MNIKEIRESGLLELYAMGVLSDQEVKEVEGYLSQFPELKKDYFEIQNALQALAQERSIKPRASLENEIVESIVGKSNGPKPNNDSGSNKSGGGGIWKFLSGLLGLCLLGAFYFYWDTNNKLISQNETFNSFKLECDSISRSQRSTLDLYNQLNSKENRILNFTPTDGFPETQLIFHFNPVEKENYIQIQSLPAIASGKAFQLWSLKADTDPIPLTVFKEGNEFIVPVDFEEGTGTYAITIEDEEGALQPTLSNLIGTVTI